MPDQTSALIEALLEEVRAHPGHQMSPYRRSELYRAYDQSGDGFLQSVPAWLACLTASRVLPAFEARYTVDLRPREMLELAVHALEGLVERDVVLKKLDEGYHSAGNAWGYDEAEMPWPAWLSANTAYHALREATGYRPLSILPGRMVGEVPVLWTDEELCQHDVADAASAAAMALAMDITDGHAVPERLLGFWTWWLTQAIPAAVNCVSDGWPEPKG